MLTRGCFDLVVAGVQHALCVLHGQATQLVGIIGQTPDYVPKLMEESSDPRGQGVAWIGTDAQLVTSGETRETGAGVTPQNIRSVGEKGPVGVEQDGGVVSGILRHTGGIGMLEEKLS
jgi:hypothetical protein